MKKLWTILLAVLLVTGLTFIGCGEVPPIPEEPTLVWSLAAWFADDYEGETYTGDFKYDETKTAKQNIDNSPFAGGGNVTGAEVILDADKTSITIPGGRTNNYDQLNIILDGSYSLNIGEASGTMWVRWAGNVPGDLSGNAGVMVARLQQNGGSYAAYGAVEPLSDKGDFDFIREIPAGTKQLNLSITNQDPDDKDKDDKDKLSDKFVGEYTFDVLEVWIGADPRTVVIEE